MRAATMTIRAEFGREPVPFDEVGAHIMALRDMIELGDWERVQRVAESLGQVARRRHLDAIQAATEQRGE